MKKKISLWVTVLICILGVVFGFFIVPKIIGVVIPWGVKELALLLTFLGIFAALTVPIISEFFSCKREKRLEKKEAEREERLETKKLERETSTYIIDIHVKILENNFVLFSASIQNVGDKRIETQIANLYIDQGVPKVLVNDRDGHDVGVMYYAFPFILEHKEEIDGRPDCVLCKKCFREHDESYPESVVGAMYRGEEDFEKLLRTHYPLYHLSSKSIKYINPKEKFSEDVIVQFKNAGVYRVTLFVGAVGTADCACATKQFYIPQSLPDNPTQ